MFVIDLAGIPVEFDNRYAHISEYCRGFETNKTPLLRIKVSSNEINAYLSSVAYPAGVEQAERVLAYRKACAKLTEYGVFLLHGAIISYCGRGIAFIADRGVGKTTHAKLWKDAFDEDVKFVNGDKPLIKKEGSEYFAYDTPWRGKAGLGGQKKVPLSAICFIGRAQNPFAVRIGAAEALNYISHQIIYPENENIYDSFSQTIADFLKCTPAFAARVNMDKSSAIYLRDTIFNI